MQCFAELGVQATSMASQVAMASLVAEFGLVSAVFLLHSAHAWAK